MKKIFLAMAVAIVTATAVSAQKDDSDSKITVSIHQTDQEDGYEGRPNSVVASDLTFRWQVW